jgi:hypothetical protein
MRPQVGFFGLNSTKLYNYFLLLRLGASTPGSYKKNHYCKLDVFFTERLFRQPDRYSNNLVHKRNPIFFLHFGLQRTQYMESIPQNMTCSHGISKKHQHKVRICITHIIAARTLSNEITWIANPNGTSL